MADSFIKYSNYDKKSAFSSIIFGSEKPLLEVELNELQQIIATQKEMLVKILGSGVNVPIDNEGNYVEPYSIDSDNTLHILDCIITGSKGVVFYVEDETVTISEYGEKVYFKVWEEDATYASELKEYGNVNGNTFLNKIMDSRSANETSRRKVIKHELLIGDSIPENTDTESYIEVGRVKYNDDDFLDFEMTNYGNLLTINKSIKELLQEYLVVQMENLSGRMTAVENQLGGITFSIEDGILTATYDDGE